MSEDQQMSEAQAVDQASSSGDELVALLAKRGKKGRARSTSILIGVLVLLIGIFIGIGLGRATAPDSNSGPGGFSQSDERPRGGPFRGGPRD
jgi:hypothetical protein